MRLLHIGFDTGISEIYEDCESMANALTIAVFSRSHADT